MPLVHGALLPDPPAAPAAAGVVDELARAEADVLLLIVPPGRPPARAIACAGDEALAARMADAARDAAVPVEVARRPIETPEALRGVAGRIVTVRAAGLEPRAHFDFGRAAGRAIEGEERIVACALVGLGSGDPGVGRIFAGHYRRAVEAWDVKWATNVEADLRRRAGEDAVRQTALLMGLLSDYKVSPRIVDGNEAFVAAVDVLGRRRGR